MDGTNDDRIRRLDDWDTDGLTALAEEFETPLYVIDLERVSENCNRLRDAFPEAEVRYAVKAHTGRSVLETVRRAGLDAECASAGEVERALAAGFRGDSLHYTAVNPPARDLDAVVSAWDDHPDITVTVGAADTLDRLDERGFDGRVCLRVNPGIGAGHHEKVRTGGHAKFGVPLSRAPETAIDAARRFDLVGLHAHAGSGISGADLADHRELVGRMGELARTVAEELSVEGLPGLEYVDVGGGFGVPYREEEPPLDLNAVAAATRDALGTVPGRDGDAARLAIEPGRYVVADAGVLLTRVNTVKPTPDTTIVGVDAGMTDLIRPALYDAYHPIANLSANLSQEAIPATVAGPICESADVFCDNRPLTRPERGDVLAVGIAGAYGYEMASQYNSRPRPAEVAVDGSDLSDSRPVRHRETVEDLTRVERPIEPLEDHE
ncbi:diaminopimelate decarboxylase [Halalkaliarchaeum desulfuricum]|uniref:Diaminopimelate decarboxylase n=1 Tax=Halalkaliarchaeum desulfuricum TaxID=2055893 RepID=A0A343TL12_9EURY|nr:diaminopimelate decarboxylase [Halalkaliarchaeum desulfuricum]AUX09784.1 diaminopimelate decarboxylase [Halalkaliarchaeum desulfuricum]